MNIVSEGKNPRSPYKNHLPEIAAERHQSEDQITHDTATESNALGNHNENGASDESTTTGEKEHSEGSFERGPRFWAIMVALAVTNILGALEGTVVSTALPTITSHLGGGESYLWAVNGYFLPNLAFQPLYAQAAEIFGRRWTYIFAVLLFAVGSVICGVALQVSVFILGRVIQGVGGSGLVALGNLIISDLVPLRQRGAYMALILIAVTIGNGMGPFIGGIIVQKTTWRWVFYLNIPLAGFSLILLVVFLHVDHRRESILRKLRRIDYAGEAILISSVTAILIALTYAGSMHPWSSWRTILPLALGFSGLLAFVAYEESPFCIEPTIPLRLFKLRTTAIACILGFLHSLVNVWVIYFLPIYFQGVFGSSPARSGVQLLPVILFLIPFAAISGKLLQQFGRYKPLAVGGLALMVIGLGLFTLLNENSSMAAWVIFQALEAAGMGLALSALLPAAQASLDDADTAKITGTFSFIRTLGISFAVTVPGAIFNSRFNSLAYRISDTSVRAKLINGQAYGHATKSFIDSLPSPDRAQVIGVYTDCLKFIWEIALGISGLAFLISLFLAEVELRDTLSTDFGIKKDGKEEPKEKLKDIQP